MKPSVLTDRLVIGALFAVFVLCGALPAEEPLPADFLYVGTYSPAEGEGILCARFDRRSGTIGRWRTTRGAGSTAALALHPSGRFLYATALVAEPRDNSRASPRAGVAAYVIEATGELREIGRRVTGGAGPCFLSVDAEGKCLLIAHCGTADVACLAIEPDGRLGEVSKVHRHEGKSLNSEGKPQAHSINVAPGNRFAVAADLGLDRLFVYRLDAARAELSPHDPPFTSLPTGSGPRHLAFHISGEFAWSINELGNTITACSFDRDRGALRTLQHVATLPAGFEGESYAADIQVHPNGRFLYGTNRGHDSIAAFRIDPKTGRLEALDRTPSGGAFPRSLAFDPSGKHLAVANQKSDRLALFRVDAESGKLDPAGPPVTVRQPVCLRFLARP